MNEHDDSPVIKHGLLENPPFNTIFPSYQPPFIGYFFFPADGRGWNGPIFGQPHLQFTAPAEPISACRILSCQPRMLRRGATSFVPSSKLT